MVSLMELEIFPFFNSWEKKNFWSWYLHPTFRLWRYNVAFFFLQLIPYFCS